VANQFDRRKAEERSEYAGKATQAVLAGVATERLWVQVISEAYVYTELVMRAVTT
jgi:hypothetical protein